ncbi:sulfotransferase domain-containing protein [Glycomyces paridis]|uniref:Sulfotransferase domain-containing protein n=1 Tax=Glycomyces paridis TaxID=2126555 RepID=A0A4S8PAE1_9ACTN|nr:sulfotransferase domain-containing protein [Glycomyces paridis]THV26691.1 sulfotransferase domain-containing protein [Glycomyces paridis]
MIVWLASYPRSGNTFFRIALHRRYGVPTYTVYDVDGVAEQIGAEPMGARDRPTSLDDMRNAPDPYFVKTHRRRDDPAVAERDRAICLVRDGRDCTVSWAHLRTRSLAGEAARTAFAAEARAMIVRRTGGTGGWGQNVRSWQASTAPAPVWVRFDDLVTDPARAVGEAVAATAPGLRPVTDAPIPSFAELHARDPGFFRSGATGAHRTELPPDLHDLFWRQPGNAAAMTALGFD